MQRSEPAFTSSQPVIMKEVQNLCSSEVFRFRGVKDLEEFSFKKLLEEGKRLAPNLLEVIKIANGSQDERRIVSSLSIMLYNRNQQINLVQKLTGSLLYLGGAQKKVTKIPFKRKRVEKRRRKK